MEYCEGFAWPVPSAFRDALRCCRFRPGDVLYTDPRAYTDWPSAEGKALQVVTATGTAEEGEDSQLLFRSNWYAGCTIEILDRATRSTSQLETTHGRLFTALWKGDMAALEGAAVRPPLGARGCLRRLGSVVQTPDRGAEYHLVVDWTSAPDRVREQAVLRGVGELDNITVSPLLPSDFGLEGISPLLRISRFTYSAGRIEHFRDVLKKALWPARPPADPVITIDKQTRPRTLTHYLDKERVTGKSVPSISDLGVFRRKPTKVKDITSLSFMHKPSVAYWFRFKSSKLAAPAVPKSVATYIMSMVEDCPNHVFEDYANTSHDGCRSASLGHLLSVRQVDHQPLLRLANESSDATSCKSRHSNLQKWFVANDPQTLAVELPVWMRAHELVDFEKTFGCERGMAGHIDLVRVEGDRIWIWDYKPNARKEKHAPMQVFLYAIMFSLRTGMPMHRLGAGYFDENTVFRVEWQHGSDMGARSGEIARERGRGPVVAP